MSSLVHRQLSLLSLVALSLSASDCSPKRSTALVVWVDTDIPEARFGVVTITVTGQGRNGPVDLYTGTASSLNALGRWPGSLVLAPHENKGVTSVDILLQYTPAQGSVGLPFSQKASTPFARNEWRQLSLFVPDQCTDPSIEARCRVLSVNGMEFTCGSADPNNP